MGRPPLGTSYSQRHSKTGRRCTREKVWGGNTYSNCRSAVLELRQTGGKWNMLHHPGYRVNIKLTLTFDPSVSSRALRQSHYQRRGDEDWQAYTYRSQMRWDIVSRAHWHSARVSFRGKRIGVIHASWGVRANRTNTR